MRTLFFVLEKKSGYVVWDMPPLQMNHLIRADPSVLDRLDHAPFKTRAQAEQRREELEMRPTTSRVWKCI